LGKTIMDFPTKQYEKLRIVLSNTSPRIRVVLGDDLSPNSSLTFAPLPEGHLRVGGDRV
jgi:hypothetical protein